MPIQVVNTANIFCAMGVAPSTLTVVNPQNVFQNQLAANIMDNKMGVNVMAAGAFGVCNSLANPATASATSAAFGVLTPQTCTPVLTAPWAPGAPTTLIANQPALNNSSTLVCAYGGTISILNPACFTVMT